MKKLNPTKLNAIGRVLAACVVWAILASHGGSTWGQEAVQPLPQQGTVRSVDAILPSAESAVEAVQRPSEKKGVSTTMMRKPTARRLPPYFASLVDSQQREAIYQIQASMADKIAELERQLAELRQVELREMEGVLSDDQRLQLETLRAARTAKTKQPSSQVSSDE